MGAIGEKIGVGAGETIRVGVMGAGAIGCWVGGQLRAAGLDVTLVGRERLRAEVAHSGLTITDLDGPGAKVRADDIRVVTDPSELRDADVVLVAVKSGATAETGRALAGILRPDAITVSLQNGVRNAGVLREALGGRQVLAAVVSFNVVVKGEGAFHRATSGPLIIERSRDPWMSQIARLLEAQGVQTRLVDDIAGLQWAKLVINLNNAVGALTDQPTRTILLESGFRRVLAATIGEAVRILKVAGIKPARMGPLPVAMFPFLLSLPTPLFRVLARAQLKVDPQARSSMWDDVVRGRATEVDELNGEIVALARSNGVAAPINQRIVDLVHEVEAAKNGSPKLSAQALWQRIAH